MDNEIISTILWDFDGVLLNSNEVRDKGFLEVLKDFPEEEVNQLMRFHQANGGLSRYVKFRYFFEKIREEAITAEEIQEWANKFSKIMLHSLINNELLIEETINFVKKNHKNHSMHIVSGSDGNELNQICKGIGINHFFKSIQGSPTPKKQLVADLIEKHQYSLNQCLLIGDSINDYEAAKNNKIYFMAFNNKQIESLSDINIKLHD